MKNLIMFKSFLKVMKGEDSEISLVVPDMYAKDVYSIDYDFLKKKRLTNLIFDIDNTILMVNDVNVPTRLISFFGKLEKMGFNICVVSNNGKDRVLPVAYALKCGYIFKASKPYRSAFERSLAVLDSSLENTVMIGDQMLTDIKGANEFGLYSILVEPVSDKYDVKTGTSRVLQNVMMKKLSKSEKFKRYDYYK